MSHDNDNAVGGFLGLVLLGATALLSYKSGQKKAYKEIDEQRRDQEILELRRQIEMLKVGKN